MVSLAFVIEFIGSANALENGAPPKEKYTPYKDDEVKIYSSKGGAS